ncbi:MAG: hypothetical protein QW739_04340, partial [Candidatus Odinarchaeota archaeon]
MDELERIRLKKMKEMIQRVNEQHKLKEREEKLSQQKSKFFKIVWFIHKNKEEQARHIKSGEKSGNHR